MFLLYLDDSGSPEDPNTQFFVYAGFSVFERQTHWLEKQLQVIASRFTPTNPWDTEFHANVMRSGKDGWQHYFPSDRVQASVDVLSLLNNQHSKINVFAAVIEKKLINTGSIISESFERVATNFDNFLEHKYKASKAKDPQRGIVIFDKSTSENNIQNLSSTFKHVGHSTGRLKNFSEVPLFLDSKASRLIQLADSIAYWIFRRYQANDDRGFKLIEPFILNYDGTKSGLFELVTSETKNKILTPNSANPPFPEPTLLGTTLPTVTRRVR